MFRFLCLLTLCLITTTAAHAKIFTADDFFDPGSEKIFDFETDDPGHKGYTEDFRHR